MTKVARPSVSIAHVGGRIAVCQRRTVITRTSVAHARRTVAIPGMRAVRNTISYVRATITTIAGGERVVGTCQGCVLAALRIPVTPVFPQWTVVVAVKVGILVQRIPVAVRAMGAVTTMNVAVTTVNTHTGVSAIVPVITSMSRISERSVVILPVRMISANADVRTPQALHKAQARRPFRHVRRSKTANRFNGAAVDRLPGIGFATGRYTPLNRRQSNCIRIHSPLTCKPAPSDFDFARRICVFFCSRWS